MNFHRAIATVGGFTMLSRITGFVRDLLIAQTLGAGPVADAFVVALRLPNLFRRLFAEGAFNAAFVPSFTRLLKQEGQTAAKIFAEQAQSVLFFFLLGLTIVCQLAMPWLMRLLAPGFYHDSVEKYALAVQLTQITFPYLICMAVVSLQGGVLNALGKFGHAAAAPIAMNLTMIAGMLAAVPFLGHPGPVLAWSVTISGVMQVIWLALACHRAGFTLRLPRPRLNPTMRRLIALMIPGVIGGGVMQFGLLIGTIIASLEPGAVASLYYAERIYQLPLGVIGAAIGVVLLPTLSRHLAQEDHNGANDALVKAILTALIETVPAAVALVVLPGIVTATLFQYGAFAGDAAEVTSLALRGYAFGLPAFVLVKALTPAFYAREDTKTPFYFALIAVVVDVATGVTLFFILGPWGLALAASLASWFNVSMLTLTLYRRGWLVVPKAAWIKLGKIIGVNILLGAILYAAGSVTAPAFAGGAHQRIAIMAAIVVGAIGLYVSLLSLSGLIRLRDWRHLLRS